MLVQGLLDRYQNGVSTYLDSNIPLVAGFLQHPILDHRVAEMFPKAGALMKGSQEHHVVINTVQGCFNRLKVVSRDRRLLCVHKSRQSDPFEVFGEPSKHATNNFVETNRHVSIVDKILAMIAYFQLRLLSLKSRLPMFNDPFVSMTQDFLIQHQIIGGRLVKARPQFGSFNSAFAKQIFEWKPTGSDWNTQALLDFRVTLEIDETDEVVGRGEVWIRFGVGVRRCFRMHFSGWGLGLESVLRRSHRSVCPSRVVSLRTNSCSCGILQATVLQPVVTDRGSRG